MRTDKVQLLDLMQEAPDNMTIMDALGKCHQQVRTHSRGMVAVSGGWDSDLMVDMIIRCGGRENTTFVFFNTGFEYEATKRHLRYLEDKYGIDIYVVPPLKPIPTCVREYGVPFWSKRASEYIYRLQKHGFQWEDEPFDVLLERYPRCRAALRWWCNDWPKKENGGESCFNIAYTPGLKEFMVQSPPDFLISPKCCEYAKKKPAEKYLEAYDFDLNCTGVRKAEGGARATAYKTCYTKALEGPDQYRPVFWFTDGDKIEYTIHYDLTLSDCYEVWGMRRTGCAGCPFGKNFEEEIELARKYEPKFHKAMLKLFGKSYDYTRRFLAFREQQKEGTDDWML